MLPLPGWPWGVQGACVIGGRVWRRRPPYGGTGQALRPPEQTQRGMTFAHGLGRSAHARILPAIPLETEQYEYLRAIAKQVAKFDWQHDPGDLASTLYEYNRCR